MSLVSLLTHNFSSRARHKGLAYADEGRVRVLGGSPTQVDAVVTGTEPYRVRIRRGLELGHPRFEMFCGCPFFAQELQPCKHLWATLVIADRQIFLGSNGVASPGGARVALMDSPTDGDAGDDEGEIDGSIPIAVVNAIAASDSATTEADDGEIPRVALRPAPSAPLPPPPPLSDAHRFLANLHQRLQAREQHTPPAYRLTGADLMFVIDAHATIAADAIVLDLLSRKRLQGGGWSQPLPVLIGSDDIAAAPGWDRRILAPLLGAGRIAEPGARTPVERDAAPQSRFRLSYALMLELLPLIAKSSRAFLRPALNSTDLHAVSWDENGAWTFRLEVAPTDDGFRVGGRFERDGDRLDLRAPIAVLSGGVIITRQSVGLWEATADFAILSELRPTGGVLVPAEDTVRLAHALARAAVEPADMPESLRVSEVDVEPRPRLHIRHRDASSHRFDAAVSFDYDGFIVDSNTPDGQTMFDDERLRMIRRRRADEREWLRELPQIGVASMIDRLTGEPAYEVRAKELASVVHTLLDDGWHVEADGARYRLAGAMHLSVTSGIDWFDLNATVEFGGQVVSLTSILAALKPGEHTVRLDDGTIGLLPEEWLRRYAPLVSAAEIHDDRLRFRRPQAAMLDALLADRALDTAIAVDLAFERVRAELATFGRVAPIDPPASFNGTLRPYQRDGLGWFGFLRRFGFGGCLADDMGLGKTVMVLALLEARRIARATKPAEAAAADAPDDAGGESPRASLVVVPRSLIPNWMSEAARFAPELRVLDYSHASRASSQQVIDSHDVVLATYGTLRRDIATFQDLTFDYVILDEAQAIKNAATASAKAARLLRGQHRLALSGTPIENHLGELWSLFEFLNPGVLGASSMFQKLTAASGATADRETTELLGRGLRPFILRRTKEQVARDLPARTEQTIVCELSPNERALYDNLRRHYRDSLLDRVKTVGVAKSQMQILEALLRLRQAACHPGLVDVRRRDESSAKFDVLLPRLREVIAEGHKALVFSQFTTLLGLLRTVLDAEGVTYEYLDGQTRDRAAPVDRFQTDPSVGLFLISLKAGGLGLNLTAADYVFLLDPWWNPAVEAQAIDRAHRIGQTREVFACRLIAQDTVEEKVLALQQSKRALADAVLSADAVGLRHLKREDLELLLS